uniref:Ras-GAP domain-containing protein n=2 Tax=Macrostomum lignano TaxID=282301 RepID=A0A1I8I4L0_9PLAT
MTFFVRMQASFRGSSRDTRRHSMPIRTDITSGPVTLLKINRPDLENLRHRENSLKLWLFEVKKLPSASKKRYYCEIYLDHILFARTTSKEKTSDADPFWGEKFEFNNLQDVALISIRLFRETNDRKKKKLQQQQQQQQLRLRRGVGGAGSSAAVGELVGEVQLDPQELRTAAERWFPLQLQQSRSSQQSVASTSIRLRAHFLSVDVLPLRCYAGLRHLATQQTLALASALESRLPLRAKEELAARLVSLAHAIGNAENLLVDLCMSEVNTSSVGGTSEASIFRGNSVATKAVEFFLRLTCQTYLKSVLTEPLSVLLTSNPGVSLSYEVDPQRALSADQLASGQRNLLSLVELFWLRIRASAELLPPEVPRLFALMRQRLAEASRQQLGDTLVGASLFLRLICPAILGPSLFGLCDELPDARASRALTLVAKAVQNLANGCASGNGGGSSAGSSFGSKEPHLQFLNGFLEKNFAQMRLFLRAASRPAPRHSQQQQQAAAMPRLSGGGILIDVGYELAQLHSMLSASDFLAAGEPSPAILTQLVKELATVDRCLLTDGVVHAVDSARQSNDDQSWVYSNVSDCSSPSQPPPQQQQQLQDDWKRIVEEAQSFTTGSSSGYQSFTPTAASGATVASARTADSPVQFYNPTYQKVATAAATTEAEVAARQSSQEGEYEDELDADDLLHRGSTTSSSNLASSEASFERGLLPPPPPTPPASNLDRMTRSYLPDASSRFSGRTAADRQLADKVKMKSRSLGPANTSSAAGADGSGTVRMGVRVRQQQQQKTTNAIQQQRTPVQYESELMKLQRELSETRLRLHATEARLRTKETEKAQLMAQFQRHHEQQRRLQQPQKQQNMLQESLSNAAADTAAVGGTQMEEIMSRLRSLESSFQQQQRSTTSSPAVKN